MCSGWKPWVHIDASSSNTTSQSMFYFAPFPYLYLLFGCEEPGSLYFIPLQVVSLWTPWLLPLVCGFWHQCGPAPSGSPILFRPVWWRLDEGRKKGRRKGGKEGNREERRKEAGKYFLKKGEEGGDRESHRCFGIWFLFSKWIKFGFVGNSVLIYFILSIPVGRNKVSRNYMVIHFSSL